MNFNEFVIIAAIVSKIFSYVRNFIYTSSRDPTSLYYYNNPILSLAIWFFIPLDVPYYQFRGSTP